MNINVLYAVTTVVISLALLWLLTAWMKKLQWKVRYKAALTMLIIPLILVVPYAVGQFYKMFGFDRYPELGFDGPGSGLLIFLAFIIGPIVGYLLGSVADIADRRQ